MKLLLLITFLTSMPLHASNPSIDNLSQKEADEVSKEFAANFTHTVVSPASSFGNSFGVELGVVGGLTTTPEMERLAKEQNASEGISHIPHAGLMVQVTVPAGLTLETTFIPATGGEDGSIQTFSGGFRWDLIHLFSNKSRYSFALKGHFSNGTFEFNDTINNSSTSNSDVRATISIENSTIGLMGVLSMDLVFIEPYIGFGHVEGETGINVDTATGSGSIFSFSNTQSYTSKNSGTHLMVGAVFDLGFLHIGAEYAKIMGINRMSGKLAISF